MAPRQRQVRGRGAFTFQHSTNVGGHVSVYREDGKKGGQDSCQGDNLRHKKFMGMTTTKHLLFQLTHKYKL